MSFKIQILFFLLVVNAISFAGTGAEFLEQIRANYSELNSLSVQMRYDLYKGHKGTELTESYTSFYARDGKKSYRKINTVEIINNEEYTIQINHTDHLITLAEPSKNELFDSNLEASLAFCNNVIVESNANGQLIQLIIKPNVDLPFSRLEIQVDKKLFVSSIVFYYSTQMDFSGDYQNPKLDLPRLVVTYENLSKRWKDNDHLLETSSYLSTQENTIKPSDPLSGYNLLNLIKN
jgi:outer membrane lipoprotein-sorting protein